MRIVHKHVRPDTLTAGDNVYSPLSEQWEPVKSAYWSDTVQRYIVMCGPLGMQMQIYGKGEKVWTHKYYFDSEV